MPKKPLPTNAFYRSSMGSALTRLREWLAFTHGLTAASARKHFRYRLMQAHFRAGNLPQLAKLLARELRAKRMSKKTAQTIFWNVEKQNRERFNHVLEQNVSLRKHLKHATNLERILQSRESEFLNYRLPPFRDLHTGNKIIVVNKKGSLSLLVQEEHS